MEVAGGSVVLVVDSDVDSLVSDVDVVSDELSGLVVEAVSSELLELVVDVVGSASVLVLLPVGSSLEVVVGSVESVLEEVSLSLVVLVEEGPAELVDV